MRVSPLLPLLFASSALLAQSAPSALPLSIDVPPGAHLIFEAKGTGNQVYVCAMRGQTAAWQFQAPEAKLVNQAGKVIGVHSAGPSWRLSDGSEIKGAAVASKPSPDAASIPWLLLHVASHNGAGQLSAAEYVQRTDTHGGVMPKDGCDTEHAGTQIRVPYTAKYSFYAKD